MELREVEELMMSVGYGAEFPAHFTNYEEDWLEGEFHLTEKGCNPLGICHGAISYGFADTLAAALSVASEAPCVTADSSLYYLREIRPGKVDGKAYFVKRGRKFNVIESEVYQGGKLCLKSTFTMAVIETPKVE
ncbi:PaaI family thioesterase [Peptoniphilus sp. KCTC 25270]|uniref:PaaI family thioesterase n=1 Tax=Peptoniphilus sp. KCTC 25270 TaxID=2897414 RepID=UPI001E2FB51D|nr:PaaI family thioesterase [Peptoniphilus sp. KCTC 25270]MCD1147807.1 PaaI family thioesterase [Peptoniphilus sp. KCTC 25270]